ncbi:hypothetical protein [uncultured Alteromonas sp.]|jgi:opacity protein-like surface antigen|uniref:hypothetical protein n=1 Tax=uncultured Alteromonas sp. TaxID=179113 RepID=UPI0025EEE693|nr:hypothetical protein [uncultured Alteromonas sp.]
MKNVMTIVLLSSFSLAVLADELEKDKRYRAKTEIVVDDKKGGSNLRVGSQSKFLVIDNDEAAHYAIKFTNIYPVNDIKAKANRDTDSYKTQSASDVIEDTVYYLSKSPTHGVPVESKVEESIGGIVSGPLIVPFKYRLDDKSVGGDATVGYYAGYGFDVPISDQYITVTPFLSAGLTQVSVATLEEDGTSSTENKSGFSWATGLLIKNWDSVNIGIVYGQDRIGDQNWEHEGEGWFSISVGWEL